MKYALGNMLNGAGGLNADQLALDLQFAADKTLTARRGPTPVLTRGSSATFVGSNGLIQTAAVNAARFDHDPVTLASRGLLIEEGRTNLFVQSDNFASASWGATNATVSSNVETAPDGSTTADKLIVNSGVTVGRVQQQFALTGPYTMSVFAKASDWGWVLISPLGAGTGCWFNLSNGTIGTQSSGFVGSIASFGNGWYRCSVSFTGSGTSLTARIVSTNADSSVSIGNGTSGIFIWGAQLEAGSFSTSYIPTTTSALARSADVCSITGSDFTGIWNGVDATMFFRGSRIANQTGQVNWDLSSGTTATSIASDRGASTERIVASAVGIITVPVFTTLAEYKIATAMKTGDYAASYNGASAITSSNAFVLSLNRMAIGMSRTNSGQLNGWIHSMKFYKKRLANAKLQALTT